MKSCLIKIICSFLTVLNSSSIAAAGVSSCGKYDQAVESEKGPEESIPDFLLQNASAAAKCLGESLKIMGRGNNSPNFSWEQRIRLNRATGGLLRLIQKNQNSPEIINKIRVNTDHNVVNLLAFGARSEDYLTRSNSMILLSNIVDNTSICVVMDHFADPSFDKIGAGDKGRVNLAAVAAVVAPWAYMENYNNIKRLHTYLKKNVVGSKNSAQINRVLDNLDQRLSYQSGKSWASNKEKPLPNNYRQCFRYKTKWAKKGAAFELIYR